MTLRDFSFLKLQDLIQSCKPKNSNSKNETNSNSEHIKKVLICDEYSLKILSSVAKMKEIIDIGVIAVLPIEINRQPMNVDAIYFIDSTNKNSRNYFINDFNKESPKYRTAYVYSIRSIPDEFVDEIKNCHLLKRRIRTLSEVHLDFCLKEDSLFVINHPSPLKPLFNGDSLVVESIIQSLFSLFVSLNTIPEIRFQTNSSLCVKIASRLNSLIDSSKARYFNGENIYKNDNHVCQQLAELTKPIPTIFLLLERSFDPITPFLHELTFQSMAADILGVKDNIYEMTSVSGKGKEAVMLNTNSNEVWKETRHQHIADVLKFLPKKLKEVSSEKKMNLPTNKASLKDLRAMLAKLPQHRAELSKYQVLTSLAEECYLKFESNKIEELCLIEQDISTGFDKNGEKVIDPLKHMFNVLGSKSYSEYDRFRLVLLFALSQSNGVPSQYLDKVLEHGHILHLKPILEHFVKMGFCVVEGHPSNSNLIKRTRQYIEGCYTLSRYLPTLKIIMDEIVSLNNSQNLDEFKVINKINLSSTQSNGNIVPMESFKFGKWKDKAQNNANSNTNSNNPNKKDIKANINNKRLVIFISGGITYSEIRSIYKFGSEKGWDTIAGSTHILSPESFIDEIKEL